MMLMGFYPAKVAVVGLVWGLVEIVLAPVAGAWAYRE